MHSKARRPTKAEQARMVRITEIGCVACLQRDPMRRAFSTCGPPEVHHLLNGGVRRGHAATVCLGSWHHRGLIWGGIPSMAESEKRYGPSLYHNARLFRELFGSDDELLAYQNSLLEEVDRA